MPLKYKSRAQTKNPTVDSKVLNDVEKLDASVDIETLWDQLLKAKPDKRILAHLWYCVKQIATMNHFTEAIPKIKSLVAGLLV